jgi:nicotinate-nucleotide adenylyltransferase
MRLVVFGGSFNPVHVGHLILAEEALEELGADACVFIPAFKAPHKDKACGARDADRLDMLKASTLGESRFLVDDCEIARKGVSYTADTLAEVIERYGPAGKPFLLIGDDLAPGFASWKDPDSIAEMADIALARRTRTGCPDFAWPHRRLENSLIELSSSDIRSKLSRGMSCRQSLSGEAFRIIAERGLYGYAGKAGGQAGILPPHDARGAVAPSAGSR